MSLVHTYNKLFNPKKHCWFQVKAEVVETEECQSTSKEETHWQPSQGGKAPCQGDQAPCQGGQTLWQGDKKILWQEDKESACQGDKTTPWQRDKNTTWQEDKEQAWQEDKKTPWQGDKNTIWQGDKNIIWQGEKEPAWQGDKKTPWQGDKEQAWQGGSRIQETPWQPAENSQNLSHRPSVIRYVKSTGLALQCKYYFVKRTLCANVYSLLC